MKKFSFLAALVLPLFIATAASAGPVVTTTNLTYGSDTSSGIGFSSNGTFYSGTCVSFVCSPNQSSTITSTVGGVTTTIVSSAVSQYLTGLSAGANGVYYISGTSTISVAADGSSSVVGTISGTARVVATGPNTNAVYAISTTGAVTNVRTGAVIATNTSLATTYGQAVVNNNGVLFVSNGNNGNVYSVTPNGAVTTLATGLLGNEAMTLAPNGIDVIVGNEFASSSSTAQFVSITPSGVVTNLGALLPDGAGCIDALATYNGNLYVGNECQNYLQLISGLNLAGQAAANTTPDAPTGLAAATVSHTTMKLSWNYQTSPTTQFICTASNGATATVTGTSCSLKGFDLYNPGSYSFSVIAVVDGVQSDAAVLSVSVK